MVCSSDYIANSGVNGPRQSRKAEGEAAGGRLPALGGRGGSSIGNRAGAQAVAMMAKIQFNLGKTFQIQLA